MGIFDGDRTAEIRAKKLMLEALETEKKKQQPYLDALAVEIMNLTEDIKRIETKSK